MVELKKKDERTRNWTFVVYPESAPENWREIIDEMRVPWVESPLHDKDVDPNGEIKKAHWHVAIFFSSKKSFEQIEEITNSLNSPIPQKVANAKGMVRYFAHMDNPEKYQYSKSEIVAHGGVDISKYLTTSGGDRNLLISEMEEWILENDCVEYSVITDYARRERFDDWYDVLINTGTRHITAYINSVRHRKKNEKEFEHFDEIGTSRNVYKKILASDLEKDLKLRQFTQLLESLENKYKINAINVIAADEDKPEISLYKAIKKSIRELTKND